MSWHVCALLSVTRVLSKEKTVRTVIYIPCLNFNGCSGTCLHWKMFIPEKGGMEEVCLSQGKACKCSWFGRKCISASSGPEKALFLAYVNLQKALAFLGYWTEISFWIWWQPFRFPLTSFKAFSRPGNWLTVGNKFLSSHAKHLPTLYSHFSAQFCLIFYQLTDHHCCSFHPPHGRVPHVLWECCGATDIKTSIVWSWEN